jgi:TolB-like protein
LGLSLLLPRGDRSVAVLPFEINMKSDLSHGCGDIEHGILSRITGAPHLRVIGCDTVAHYPSHVDPRTLRRDYGVDTVVSGSLGQDWTSIQMVNTADGSLEWSREWPQPCDPAAGAVSCRESIVREVCEKLVGRLRGRAAQDACVTGF